MATVSHVTTDTALLYSLTCCLVGIIRTMVAEMVPERELQPRAFSIMPLVWSLGSVVGPAFGGFFAQPATQYPNLFGNVEFLKKFPYLLPNLIATIFFLISAASATLFLKVGNNPFTGYSCRF